MNVSASQREQKQLIRSRTCQSGCHQGENQDHSSVFNCIEFKRT